MSEASHAALMDGVYRYQRHIYDLTRRYYLLGRDQLIEALDPPTGSTVVEIGGGTGRNLIKAAKRYPNARFFGVDISTEMLETAKANIGKAGLAHRIRLARADATNWNALETFKIATFDRVFVSYSVSMIPPWRAALDHSASLVAPGGTLMIIDFGDCAGLPPAFRRLLHVWLEKFHVSPREDLIDYAREVAKSHALNLDARKLFRGYAQLLELQKS